MEERKQKPTRAAISETVWPTREQARESLLFRPMPVGPLDVRRRTWVPAMVPWRASADGDVTREVIDWYGRFADGRPGVLVAEATGIRDVPSGPLLRIGHDRFVPGLRELTDNVRAHSGSETRFLVQLIDFLAIKRRPPVDKFVLRFLDISTRHREHVAKLTGRDELLAANEADVREALLALPLDELIGGLTEREADELQQGYRERVGDLHLEHIAQLPSVLPALFAEAAGRARRAGFDGVELHFAHAYTMASFLSRRNERSDGYGGSAENRVRLPLEVIAAVRAEVGRDFALGCRFLGDEVIDGGSRIADAAYYGERFARAGLDFLSVSKGGKFEDAKQPKVGQAAYPYTGPSGHECMPTVRIGGVGPFGRNLPLSRAIRARVRAAGFETPVVGAGGINSFELAEAALRNGDCDLVAAARQALADPDWFLKMEQGRGAEVRRCIYTNYCEALDQRHVEVTCQLWDRDFDEPDGDGAIARSADGKRRLLAPPT